MKIPGMGEVKTPYVVAGGGAVVLVLGYAYYRNKKQAAAAASAAAASTAAANTDVNGIGAGSSGIDPNTGLPYADAGYGSTYGGIDPATGVPYYDEITQSGQTTNPNAITTNQQWIQQAEADGQNLFNATYALTAQAVQDYLAQSPKGLPPNEYQLIQSLVAELGMPPQGGPYRLIQATGPVTGGGTTGTTGKSLAQAVGQVIQVPANIVPPNSMTKLAAAHGISLAHLIANNPGSSAAQTGLVNVPYNIHPGDTLTKLASMFGDSPEHMAQILQSQGIS